RYSGWYRTENATELERARGELKEADSRFGFLIKTIMDLHGMPSEIVHRGLRANDGELEWQYRQRLQRAFIANLHVDKTGRAPCPCCGTSAEQFEFKDDGGHGWSVPTGMVRHLEKCEYYAHWVDHECVRRQKEKFEAAAKALHTAALARLHERIATEKQY